MATPNTGVGNAELKNALTADEVRADIAAALGEPDMVVGDDDDILRLGLDSLSVMRLTARWHKRGAKIAFADLVERRTFAEWWRLLSPGDNGAEPSIGDARAAGGQLPAVDEAAAFELATMQHAYWIGRSDGQLLGGVGAHFYNEFDGRDIDPRRLEHAVRALIVRHGMLRAQIDDVGRQRILPDPPWSGLTVNELRNEPAEAVAGRLQEIRDQLCRRRMRVERGEVFDVQLSRLPDGTDRVHVQVEMLVADAQSFRVLISDLARLYQDPDTPLPAIELSYPRYLAAAAALRANQREAAREYWQTRIPDLPGPPELPVAADPAAVARHEFGRRRHWLDAAQAASLTRRAQQHGLTPSAVFLAVYAEVLAAWSGTPRFVVNLPLYDRQPVHPDVPLLVGEFTNLLLLEVDVRPEDRASQDGFASRAARLQKRLRTDTAHSAYTGVEVLRDLARHRDGLPVGAPVVFTSALSLGELFDSEVRRCFGDPGWTMSQTPQVWLDFQLTEWDGGLLITWEVVEELFPPGLVDAMFEACRQLIGWLLDADWTDPVPGLLPESQRVVRERANATDRAVRDRLLQDDFLTRARRDPDRTALLWGEDGRCTYRQLAAAAGELARSLTAAGVAPGDRVGVSLPKGPEQVVAALGVLCAGATYVPVGIDQPVRRRTRMLTTAGVRYVISAVDVTGLPAQVQRIQPLGATSAGDVGAAAAPTSPVYSDPEAPAYLLFTSGSTGEPKGVEVPHRAAVNTIDDLNERLSLAEEHRVLAVSALEFDLSVYDIFSPLSVGGAVVLVGESERRNAAAWLELVRRHRVTVWQSAPALLDMLLIAAEPGEPLPLRLALLGGDWVGLDLSARLDTAAPGARLVALGGTTETAIHSTVQQVPVEPPEAWRSVPYGLPLGNQRLRVVDEHGRDRPDWVPGELWIGGRSVALGYHGDPVRTGERFVEHSSVRWYRTGDLARYWPDGTVEFCGRADFQVKIRGHRIELGEVEAALQSHPGVTRAVAAVSGENTGRQLIAAVAARSPAPDETELKAAVADLLPPHMVPVRIAVWDALPLSPNGKIDRSRVTTLVSGITAEGSVEPPSGDMERTVAEIWADLLAVSRVGRTDSFFALGGDSLTATRLLSRLRAAGLTGADLPTLFGAPTLAAFAARLRRGETSGGEPPLVPDPDHRHEPFPATDVQRAYWMGRADDFALGGVGSHWYWEFDGVDVDIPRLERSLNTLIGRHDMLRAVFDDNGRQRVLPEVDEYVIEVADGDEALAELRQSLSRRIPDPGRWPLIEVRAVRYGAGRTRLGFSFDYIVLDALSIVRFFGELTALYDDPEAELPPLRITFRDYVLGAAPPPDELAAAQRYWSERIDELPPAPPLPLAKDPSEIAAPQFHRREDWLPPTQWRALTDRARRHNLTPAAVLAAAFAEVLTAWSGRDSVTLNLTMFNRRDVHPDIENLLGDFTSLLLVPHHAVPDDSFLAVGHRFQERVWEGMAHGAVSALWVLRELARRTEAPTVSMPVVFTSALGVAGELTELTFPFGHLVWGISQTPQVWLDNQVMERDGGLAYNWDSVDELFCDGALDAMFDAYRRLLRWLAETEWTLPAPDLLPAEQRVVREKVNTTAGPAVETTLHSGFFAQAATAPQRVAVLHGDEQVTYGELADRALRVADWLRDSGLRLGEPVEVRLPRGAEQIAAVLGVLAAGGAYVPIGLDQPEARRDRIRAIAGARLAVTGDLPAGRGGPPTAPVHDDPDQLAYIIFTSGSTGEPKGVEITHRAAMNTIVDINHRFGVGPEDRVLAVSSLDFDLSVYDIFGLLSAGGALVLVGEDDRREARSWVELIRRHRVTVWNSVPALLEMTMVVAEGADPEPGLDSLRLVLASGDWVGLELPGRVRRAAPGARFVALGGATEAAIWSNAYEVDAVPPHWRSVPYGLPLRNQRYRVVGARDRDCPDWVVGELHIGGAGVARGYRNDPATTAEHFVEHAGGRWYRTGDLGRYWSNGILEFRGRSDSQVKIRGHRIELGEIAAAAESHPDVAHAIALTVGHDAGRHLVAAVVGGSTAARPDSTAVAGLLADRLPSYMVPERIVVLDRMPLSGNGKVDRRQVAAQLGPAPTHDEPPRGETEDWLAGLWRDLLDHDTITRNDSFFVLGGDSLLATRLVETIRRRAGVPLALRELFAAATVARLAALVDARRGAPGAGEYEEGTL